MSMTMRTKINDMLKEQDDEEYLILNKLPKIPKGNYQGPTISYNGAGPR